MFASIRRYRLQRGSMDDLARRVDEEFAEQICAQSGFVSYEFMDCGEGEIMTVSMFAESEQADGSRDLARRWTEQRLRDIEFSTLDAMCRVLECQPGDLLEWVDDVDHVDQVDAESGDPGDS